jgi:release factor glutamine methyltransferase
VERRSAREPLQYIIGRVGFYREEYKVTPDVLIPRADTEHLVDYAVKHIPEGERFLDLCCGSGCVGISTLSNTKNTTAALVDVSPAALAVARENAEACLVSERAEFILGDITKSIPEDEVYAVLSNPPYVARSVYEALEPEIGYEPKIAFVGGEDGGDFYRLIVPMAKRVIKKEGFIALEIGYDQAALLKSLADEHTMSLEIIKDYSGNDRVAILKNK